MPAVRYLVEDVGVAVEFYVGQLGFQEKDRYGPAMAIRSSGTRRYPVRAVARCSSRTRPATRSSSSSRVRSLEL
jgi:hypothetical protein